MVCIIPIKEKKCWLSKGSSLRRDLPGYIKQLNKYGTLIVQIEHIDAVKNIDEIFSNKTIDGFFIGPNDLSASMGIPGDIKNTKLKRVMRQVSEKAKKYNVTGDIILLSQISKN